jgi:hypothetical protein
LEDPKQRWEDRIRMDVGGEAAGVESGFSWFSIATGGGLL